MEIRYRSYSYRDKQDESPAFYDDCGTEVYPGETYWETDDGAVDSEESWRRLRRSLIDTDVVLEGRLCYA